MIYDKLGYGRQMNRSSFLKNVAVASLTPMLLKDLVGVDPETETVVIAEPNRKRVAIDLDAIKNVGMTKDGQQMTAKVILEIYFDTGILLYRRPPQMGADYSPITVID